MEIRQDYRVGRVAGSSGLLERRERDALAKQCIIRRTYAVDNAAAGLGSRVNSASGHARSSYLPVFTDALFIFDRLFENNRPGGWVGWISVSSDVAGNPLTHMWQAHSASSNMNFKSISSYESTFIGKDIIVFHLGLRRIFNHCNV